MREKKTDRCCVGSGMKYQSLTCWSIAMMSVVEFWTGEFHAKQVLKVLENDITNQEKESPFRKSRTWPTPQKVK